MFSPIARYQILYEDNFLDWLLLKVRKFWCISICTNTVIEIGSEKLSLVY